LTSEALTAIATGMSFTKPLKEQATFPLKLKSYLFYQRIKMKQNTSRLLPVQEHEFKTQY
jgi:hypothetical protein